MLNPGPAAYEPSDLITLTGQVILESVTVCDQQSISNHLLAGIWQ